MSSPLFHIESEQSVLGGLLIDPKAFEHVYWLQESDFYREEHRLIFRHIVMMLAERQPVDVVTVAESLVTAGVDEDSTGLAYLGELAANTPSAANIRRYAAAVSEKRALRDLLAASAQIADIANAEGSKPADQRIDEAQAVVFALAERRIEGSEDPETIGALLPSVIEDIQARYDILMMYRDEYYNPDTPDKGIAEIIVAKQRMGETGIIPVLFRGEFSRFENLTSEAKRELFDARRLAKPMARGTRGFD